MKIAREDITRLAQACARIADGKHAAPAYRMTLLEASDGRMTAKASNGDYWLTLHAPCDGDLAPVLAPASRLADTVARMTADTIDLSNEQDSLLIKAKGSRRKIAVLPPDSFPVLPEQDGASVTLDAGRLLDGLAFCQPFASTDSVTLGYLCGVNFNCRDGRLYLAASDGNAVVEFDYGEAPDMPDATVPTGLTAEISKLGLSSDVTLSIGERKLAVRWAEGVLMAPRIEQKFVDYRRIVPAVQASAFIASADDLSKAVRGVQGLGGDAGKFGVVVTVTVQDGNVDLSARSHEGEASDVVEASIEGDVPVFGVSSTYLDRVMRGFSASSVKVGVTDAQSPLKFTSDAMPERLAVVMPRRI